MKKLSGLIAMSAGSTFLIMFGYESCKELIFKGTLQPWESHWITITFTTILSLIITVIASNNLLTMTVRETKMTLKEEKLKSIHQVMRIAQHNVNNLANNLHIVQLEIEQYGTVMQDTLELLNNSIHQTSREMQRMGTLSDPFDENAFAIQYQ